MSIFSRLSIQSKLMVCLLVISLASILFTSYVGYTSGRTILREEIFDYITELRISRTRQIEALFAQVRNHAIALAEAPTVISATKSFRDAFAQLEEQPLEQESLSKLWFFFTKMTSFPN